MAEGGVDNNVDRAAEARRAAAAQTQQASETAGAEAAKRAAPTAQQASDNAATAIEANETRGPAGRKAIGADTARPGEPAMPGGDRAREVTPAADKKPAPEVAPASAPASSPAADKKPESFGEAFTRRLGEIASSAVQSVKDYAATFTSLEARKAHVAEQNRVKSPQEKEEAARKAIEGIKETAGKLVSGDPAKMGEAAAEIAPGAAAALATRRLARVGGPDAPKKPDATDTKSPDVSAPRKIEPGSTSRVDPAVENTPEFKARVDELSVDASKQSKSGAPRLDENEGRALARTEAVLGRKLERPTDPKAAHVTDAVDKPVKDGGLGTIDVKRQGKGDTDQFKESIKKKVDQPANDSVVVDLADTPAAARDALKRDVMAHRAAAVAAQPARAAERARQQSAWDAKPPADRVGPRPPDISPPPNVFFLE